MKTERRNEDAFFSPQVFDHQIPIAESVAAVRIVSWRLKWTLLRSIPRDFRDEKLGILPLYNGFLSMPPLPLFVEGYQLHEVTAGPLP